MQKKPEWLRKKTTLANLKEMDALLLDAGVNTVCKEAMCPNISECFSKKEATFLILGNVCTRRCTFCNVAKGSTSPVDPSEPQKVADAVRNLGLKHVVITSPTRDDLDDGGAGHFYETVRAIKNIGSSITVELLVPDMRENQYALARLAASGAEIIGHNLETVPRLYHIRNGAEYERSLRVLKALSSLNPDISTKSGIMLGLGESEEEVLETMRDIMASGCVLLSIGQYLSPSQKHAKVVEYVRPERFEYFYEIGMKMGFRHVKSSPYTRSSYMAHEYI